MCKGAEVVIWRTVSLLNLVLGWAVGKELRNVGLLFSFLCVDPPRSGYVPFPLLIGLVIDIA